MANTKRYSHVEEDLVVKPSTELIPDEYDHKTNRNIKVHLFYNNGPNPSPMYEEEAKKFAETLTTLDYVIKPEQFHDVEKQSIEDTLQTIQKECDNIDALVMFFACSYNLDSKEGLSFKGKIRESPTKNYEIHNVWSKFTAQNCPALRNKPKIFIFAMSKHVPKVTTDGSDNTLRILKYESTYDTPSEADILVVYSSEVERTDFVYTLCDNIKEYGKMEDLSTIATISDPNPLVISTLTRKFYTTISSNRGHHLVVDDSRQELQKISISLQEELDYAIDRKEKSGLRNKFASFLGSSKKDDNKVKRPESIKNGKVERAQSLKRTGSVKKAEKKAVADPPVKKEPPKPPRSRLNSSSSAIGGSKEVLKGGRRVSVDASNKPRWRP